MDGVEGPRCAVLFTHPHLGDVVNTTPAGGWLRSAWPRARLVAVTSPVGKELFDAAGDFDEVLLRPEGPFDQARLVATLRGLGAETAVFTYSQRTLVRLAVLAGIRERWVVQGDRPSPRATLSYAPVGDEPEVPETLSRLLNAAGLDTPSLAPVVRPSTAQVDEAQELVARLDPGRLGVVSFHTGSSHPAKRWPSSHWAELARAVEATSHPVAWIGTGEESAHIAGMGGTDLCGRWPVLGTAAFLSQCRCLVTGDSGPMHLAAGVGCRVVGLFGPTSSRRHNPFGEGHVLFQGPCPKECGSLDACRGGCMAGLHVEPVLRAVLG